MSRLYVSKGFFPARYFEDTVDYIRSMQDARGAIAWFEDGHLDPWDHVEAAMGLTIGGRFDEARHAYQWLADNQRPDGSWLAAYKNGEVVDGTRAETNFVAYVATGILALLPDYRGPGFPRRDGAGCRTGHQPGC